MCLRFLVTASLRTSTRSWELLLFRELCMRKEAVT